MTMRRETRRLVRDRLLLAGDAATAVKDAARSSVLSRRAPGGERNVTRD
ncbi:MAG TPA: hypothetical protein VES62_17620 [Thermoleophilaceae bacterium]|nr:hypothetical protein [Thermoleophilaceae bacterium]